MTAATINWVFSIKNPTIESEVSWSSLLSFLHFRRKQFTTDGAVLWDYKFYSMFDLNSLPD